jgi:hypothetical protein
MAKNTHQRHSLAALLVGHSEHAGSKKAVIKREK